jgi:HPt (histidine-containing phosphotransfer) domain-containing protein
MKGDRDRCLQAGMDAYISKPIDPRELAEVIERAAGRNSLAAEPFEASALLDLVGGDWEFLRELVSLFRSESPKRLREIQDAIGRGDAEAVRLAAHALKGSVANFFARDAVEAARRLEESGGEGNLAGAEGACAALEKALRELDSALAALVSRTNETA